MATGSDKIAVKVIKSDGDKFLLEFSPYTARDKSAKRANITASQLLLLSKMLEKSTHSTTEGAYLDYDRRKNGVLFLEVDGKTKKFGSSIWVKDEDKFLTAEFMSAPARTSLQDTISNFRVVTKSRRGAQTEVYIQSTDDGVIDYLLNIGFTIAKADAPIFEEIWKTPQKRDSEFTTQELREQYEAAEQGAKKPQSSDDIHEDWGVNGDYYFKAPASFFAKPSPTYKWGSGTTQKGYDELGKASNKVIDGIIKKFKATNKSSSKAAAAEGEPEKVESVEVEVGDSPVDVVTATESKKKKKPKKKKQPKKKQPKKKKPKSKTPKLAAVPTTPTTKSASTSTTIKGVKISWNQLRGDVNDTEDRFGARVEKDLNDLWNLNEEEEEIIEKLSDIRMQEKDIEAQTQRDLYAHKPQIMGFIDSHGKPQSHLFLDL